MKKTILYRGPGGVELRLTMKELNQILKDKGVDKAGDIQQFHTQNVLRRVKRYMPFLTGATYKITAIQTDIRKPEIVTDVPYGKYLFYGCVMVGNAPKTVTGKPLKYTKTKNPMAGPHWDRTLSATEGRAMAADLQRYIRRKG